MLFEVLDCLHVESAPVCFEMCDIVYEDASLVATRQLLDLLVVLEI